MSASRWTSSSPHTTDFVAAIKAGDIDKAKALYGPARTIRERRAAGRAVSDLDGSIDSRADDNEQKEKDPGFVGFHRIEYALYTDNSVKEADQFTDKLVADVKDLQAASPA